MGNWVPQKCLVFRPMHHLRYSLSKHGFIDLRVLVTFVSAQSMIRGRVAQSMIYGVRHQNNLMTTWNSYSIELNIRCFWMFLAGFNHHFISRKRPGQHLRKSLRRLPSEYPDSLSNQSLRSFDQIFSSLRGGKVNKTCKLVITLPQLTWQVYIPLKTRPFAAAKERIVSLNHQFSGVNSL